MKELSIEEKAKAYDEAIERMKSWARGEHPECFTEAQKAAEFIFPELKESEDEKIRKELIKFVKVNIPNEERYIAWLEKQGEQKHETPIPRFNIGDWVIVHNKDAYQVIGLNTYDYRLQHYLGGKMNYPFKYESDLKPWTIQYSKDGDVLVNQNGEMPFIFKECKNNHIYCYCGYTNHKDIFFDRFVDSEGEELHWLNLYHEQVYPATKEQRNLLFSKMKKAGYEWDAEKKELKEIEQKSVFEMKTPEESLGIDSNTYNKIVDECIYGEQKPADVEEISFFEDFRKTDSEVEPKFHEGEWITNGDYTWKIVEVKPLDYILQSQEGNIVDDTISHVDEQFHSFTIKDAKDGDVLSDGTTIFIFKDLLSDGSVMSYCDYDTDSGESDAFCPLSVNLMCSKITPSTKEQHDLLFTKMKEAGYEWDAKNKELKKIIDKEQIKKNLQDNGFRRMFEQEFAWSEEDNEHLERILKELENQRQRPINNPYLDKIESDYNWLKSLKDRVQPQIQQEWSKEDETMTTNTIIMLKEGASLHFNKNDITKAVNWLKSLRPQNTWKPSDEQMEVFRDLIEDNNQRFFISILKSLYNDLKKLKD